MPLLPELKDLCIPEVVTRYSSEPSLFDRETISLRTKSLLYCIVMIFLLTSVILSAILTEFEIVVSASGVIGFDQRPTKISFNGPGIIKRLVVSDGQWIKKDTILLDIDDSDLREDQSVIKAHVHISTENLATEQLIVGNIISMTNGEFPLLEEIDNERARAELDTFLSRHINLSEQIDALRRRMTVARDTVEAEERRLELAEEHTRRVLALVTTGAISERAYTVQREETTKVARDRLVSMQRLLELDQELGEVIGAREEHEKSIISEKLIRIDQYNAAIEQSEAELNRIVQRRRRYSIVAPHDGLVSNLNYAGVGEYVVAGSVVLELVSYPPQTCVSAR